MEIGKAFGNIESYNKKMMKTLKDKLFFNDFLPDNNSYMFIDFGCADGTMINTLYEMYKDNTYHFYIGYDISDTMITLAKTNFSYPVNNVMFTSNWKDVEDKIKPLTSLKKVLILSSVVHEVYSYANNENDIKNFWNILLNSDFDYICVRDMMPSSDIDRNTYYPMLETFREHLGIKNSDYTDVKMLKLINDFEDIHGSITNNKNFVHFLLKYRYIINWDREVHENYFPIYVEDFVNKLLEKYSLTYFQRFRVKFMDDCIYDDFKIRLNDYTHAKMIFEKRRN